MYPSVFGVADASLPKQVERILLMAEKFPLALLCIVDLTAVRVVSLCRTFCSLSVLCVISTTNVFFDLLLVASLAAFGLRSVGCCNSALRSS